MFMKSFLPFVEGVVAFLYCLSDFLVKENLFMAYTTAPLLPEEVSMIKFQMTYLQQLPEERLLGFHHQLQPCFFISTLNKFINPSLHSKGEYVCIIRIML